MTAAGVVRSARGYALRVRPPLLLLPALVGALLLPAAPASAAGGITSPGTGEVVTTESVVLLRAVVEGPAATPSELSLIEPGTGRETVVAVSASPGGGELTADFDTACASQCTGRAPARNGRWTLRLRGSAEDERTFELRIPPAVPSDVAAEPAGQGVLLRWVRGDEPDLTGYAVEDADGAPVAQVALDACDATGRCRLEVPADTGSWAVRAVRTACPGCAETLRSEPSAPVSLTSAGPPVPALPEPSPSSSAAQPVQDQRSAFVRSYGTGVRLPAPAPAAVPRDGQAAPPPGGTYDVALDYAPPPPGAAAGGASLEETLSGIGGGSRLPLLLLSGLLVGSSVLLRRWLRRAVLD